MATLQSGGEASERQLRFGRYERAEAGNFNISSLMIGLGADYDCRPGTQSNTPGPTRLQLQHAYILRSVRVLSFFSHAGPSPLLRSGFKNRVALAAMTTGHILEGIRQVLHTQLPQLKGADHPSRSIYPIIIMVTLRDPIRE